MTDEADALYNKYRPDTFELVLGQNAVVKALERVLKKGTSRAFVFAGPSGVGKTTLARISATYAGCTRINRVEIDAALNTGVDAMRKVAEAIRYVPMGKGAKKAVIVDEAHRLSGQAWDSLLKAVEEAPKHALWFFCTTNGAKLPATLKTRCVWLSLVSVSDRDIRRLVDDVASEEKIRVSESVVDLIVRQAHGSPRQALVNLAACDGVKDKKEAAEILHTALSSDATIELCRFMLRPGSWVKLMSIITKLDGQSPEGLRIIVCNYYASVLKRASSERDVTHALSVLEAFSQEYNQAEGMAPLFLSVGRVMYP